MWGASGMLSPELEDCHPPFNWSRLLALSFVRMSDIKSNESRCFVNKFEAGSVLLTMCCQILPHSRFWCSPLVTIDYTFWSLSHGCFLYIVEGDEKHSDALASCLKWLKIMFGESQMGSCRTQHLLAAFGHPGVLLRFCWVWSRKKHSAERIVAVIMEGQRNDFPVPKMEITPF